jgi:hypothetical protein
VRESLPSWNDGLTQPARAHPDSLCAPKAPYERRNSTDGDGAEYRGACVRGGKTSSRAIHQTSPPSVTIAQWNGRMDQLHESPYASRHTRTSALPGPLAATAAAAALRLDAAAGGRRQQRDDAEDGREHLVERAAVHEVAHGGDKLTCLQLLHHALTHVRLATQRRQPCVRGSHVQGSAHPLRGARTKLGCLQSKSYRGGQSDSHGNTYTIQRQSAGRAPRSLAVRHALNCHCEAP